MKTRKLTKAQKAFKEKTFDEFFLRVCKLLSGSNGIYIFDKITGYGEKGKLIAGVCDWENIKVDPFLIETNLISVTLHESAHWFFPDWKEKKILNFEKKCMRVISRGQYKKMLKLITKKL